MNKLYITLLMALCLCLSAYPQASGAFKYKNDIYYLQNVTVDANNSTGVNVPTLLLIGSNVVNDGFVGPVVLTSTANISASVEINRMAEYWRMLPNVRINQGAKFTLDYYKSFPVGNRSFLSELPVKLAFIGGNAGLKIFSNFTGSKYDYETETPPLYFPDPNQKDNKFGVCAQEMINSESDTVSWLAFGYDKPNSFFNNSLSVDQNGNVLIANHFATVYPSYKLSVFSGNRRDVLANRFLVSSDVKLKEDIESLSEKSIGLLQIDGKSYNKKSITEKMDIQTISSDIEYGLIAQDVASIYPELVLEDSNGFLSLDYMGFLPLILEQIKEQQTIIDENAKILNRIKDQLRYLDEKNEVSAKVKVDDGSVCFSLYTKAPIKIKTIRIMIYDIASGNLEWQHEEVGIDQFKEIIWNKVSLSGLHIRSGVYLYKIELGMNSSAVSIKTGKLLL